MAFSLSSKTADDIDGIDGMDGVEGTLRPLRGSAKVMAGMHYISGAGSEEFGVALFAHLVYMLVGYDLDSS